MGGPTCGITAAFFSFLAFLYVWQLMELRPALPSPPAPALELPSGSGEGDFLEFAMGELWHFFVFSLSLRLAIDGIATIPFPPLLLPWSCRVALGKGIS